jgi:hypothetical protein
MAAELLTRKAAGTLLRAQAITEGHVNRALKDGIQSAAAVLSTAESRRSAASTMSALLTVSPDVSHRLQAAIVAGRQNARQMATGRLVRELSDAGVDLSPHSIGGARPLLKAFGAARLHEDETFAKQAAESLVTQWRALAMHDIRAAERAGQSPSSALKKSLLRMTHRVARTAETETARSYGSEHKAALLDAMRFDDGLAREIASADIVREWSCRLDACPQCIPYDGEQAALDGEFLLGAEPGELHPRCRCLVVMVPATGIFAQLQGTSKGLAEGRTLEEMRTERKSA